MNIKSVITGIVLTSAIAFSAPAFASATINGATLSGGDLSSVQSRCNQLETAANTPVSLTESNADFDADHHLALDGKVRVSGLDQATTRINLYSISLQDCVQAGLVASK